MKGFPLITAHSGSMNEPDNTLEALEAGIMAGADIVEDDIRATRDGMLVLAHDDELQTADGSTHLISHLDYEPLRALPIAMAHGKPAAGRRIADLASALTLVKSAGKRMNLDMKTDDALEPLAALLHRKEWNGHVFLTGCETERARLAQRLLPDVPRLLNASVRLFRERASYEEAVRETVEDALSAGCFGINAAFPLVREPLLEAAASAGLAVYVWTIDDEAGMEEAIRMGVRSITTRNVAALVRLKAYRIREGRADA